MTTRTYKYTDHDGNTIMLGCVLRSDGKRELGVVGVEYPETVEIAGKKCSGQLTTAPEDPVLCREVAADLVDILLGHLPAGKEMDR